MYSPAFHSCALACNGLQGELSSWSGCLGACPVDQDGGRTCRCSGPWTRCKNFVVPAKLCFCAASQHAGNSTAPDASKVLVAVAADIVKPASFRPTNPSLLQRLLSRSQLNDRLSMRMDQEGVGSSTPESAPVVTWLPIRGDGAHRGPRIGYAPRFLSDAECDELIRLAQGVPCRVTKPVSIC